MRPEWWFAATCFAMAVFVWTPWHRIWVKLRGKNSASTPVSVISDQMKELRPPIRPGVAEPINAE